MRRNWPDLASLELFLLVGSYGSIGRAAAEMGLTQASASRRLDTLERELGVPLLVRDTTGSRLTPQGRAVLERAGDAVAAAEELLEGVAALRRRRRAVLGVAASMTVAEYLMPGWLAALRAAEPGIEVGLRVVNSEDVGDLVHDGAVDLGFIESLDLPRDLAAAGVGTDRLAVVTAPGHPWARRGRPVAVGELAATPLVMRERGSGTRTTLEQALARTAGVEPAAPALELPSNAAVKVAVTSGAAPAVLSVLAVTGELADGRLREVPVSGVDLRRPLRAVWPRRFRLSAPAAHLVRIATAPQPR
ncbi:DNA-binding transcriptional LysR family regulator [Spinactinospora alkalitolerans]|uniref:DNA-binding transcriptional LysR family regulator n=1 Tax=Spinactinospora alkalitolerans TaxID=687207 RepID=A0A852TWP8_9ACTN|nr:LysR family transcriptional regulator [Spinactinospora alkalitolerans]NYE46494.1 DNA-binding transcriptional LysR family regulator [Spinactinospora alkalitolerans]